MLKAFILIKLKSKGLSPSIEALKKVKDVKRICTLTGEWDLLIEFEGESPEDLHDFHFSIDSLDSIEDIVTNVVMKEYQT
jgi:DNA-binding Lrp family transcriptional regulator